MRSKLPLLVLFAVAATAGSAAVVLLESVGVILSRPANVNPHTAATAALDLAPATELTPADEPAKTLSFSRLAFVTPDLLPLRRETFNDLTGDPTVSQVDNQEDTSADGAWTEGTIVDAEADPAPVTSFDWGAATRIDRTAAVLSHVAAARTAANTATLPVVRIAYAPAERMPPFAPLTGRGQRSAPLAARLAQISPAASSRLAEKFLAAGAAWPPAEATFLALKDTRALELYGRSVGGAWTFVHRYKVLAASGGSGPKLRKGDRQVPEGIYKISYLNPESRYHVSMRLNYPNAFDRQKAVAEGRKELGGDIMIHGKALSAGCLAMGDEAAEELFVLADRVGLAHVKVVIVPADFRRDGLQPPKPGAPAWLGQLYAELATEMSAYKAPPAPSIATSLLSAFWK